MFKFFIYSFALATVLAKCPMNGLKFNDLCFYFRNSPSNFDVAEQMCLNLGGHLASIHDAKTNELIIRRFLMFVFWLSFQKC